MAIELDILRNVPIFQLLDEGELRDLIPEIEERIYVAGQTIFKKGQPGGEMHVVLSGKVETFIVDEDGQRVVLAEVEPGEMFGELSLFDAEPRSASAVALAATRTCTIDRQDLSHLFAKKPHAALDILGVLSKRIRHTDQLLQQRVARNPNVVIAEEATFGDRVADAVARFGGSWWFINLFLLLMLGWIGINTWWVLHPFDPPPYIGLNLILSMLAALQAPVIMMSQNRQDTKDRVRADLDYQVNLKAEVEIMDLHRKVDTMKEELLELLVRIKDGGRSPG
jgi:CRP/FNR family transcriptional regulator, cyclic AMP receptor protein